LKVSGKRRPLGSGAEKWLGGKGDEPLFHVLMVGDGGCLVRENS